VPGRVVAAVVLLVVAATCIGAAEQAFTIGVLRRDGVVIPFAAFDGKNWKPVWPDSAMDVEVPIDLRNVPRRWWGPVGPLTTWEAHTSAPAPVNLHVRQPDLVSLPCRRQIGLRTDYRPAEPPPSFAARPYPKDGLVVSPPQQVERVEVLGARSPEWTAFAPFVTDAFNKTERSIAAEQGHPVISTSEREATNPLIEAIYAYGTDPRIYYVEAAREYWSEPKINECVGLAFGHLWLLREGGVVKPMNRAVIVQNCDRSDTNYMLPLGVLAAGGRFYWVAQLAGWNSESYAVFEITRTGAVEVVGRLGGAC
jgi:hypothetical protein